MLDPWGGKDFASYGHWPLTAYSEIIYGISTQSFLEKLVIVGLDNIEESQWLA